MLRFKVQKSNTAVAKTLSETGRNQTSKGPHADPKDKPVGGTIGWCHDATDTCMRHIINTPTYIYIYIDVCVTYMSALEHVNFPPMTRNLAPDNALVSI